MNSSKTILHTEAATGFGGQQIRILNELIGLKQKGYRMLLAAPESSQIFREANKLDIETFPVSFTRNAFFSSIFKIIRIINQEPVNIISTHSSRDSWPASIAARISSKKPMLVRTRHMSHPIRNTFYNRFLYASLPYKIVCTGEAIKTELNKTLHVPIDKIISIPSGIDLTRFDKTKYNRVAFRQKLNVQENEVIIAVIALLIEYKGHQYLVDAIDKIRDTQPLIKVWFIGDGPLSDTLARMIQAKHLENRIQQLGFRDNIPEILAATDLTVLPSIGTEGVPQVLTQSAAMELPIIATDVGAVSEIVQDGVNGFLIPPKDSNAIAAKIAELATHSELRYQMGLAGRKIAMANFSLTKMLNKIESVYQA
jgi:glycosyltransferase involved in cell wall biosynthesis